MSTSITPIRSFEPAIRKQQRLAARQHFGIGRSFHHEAMGHVRLYEGCGNEGVFHQGLQGRQFAGWKGCLRDPASFDSLGIFRHGFFPDFNFEHPDRNHNGNESFSFETHQSDLFSRKSAIDRRAFAQARCNFEIKMGRRVLLGWVRGIPVNGIIQTFRWSVLVSVFSFSFFPPFLVVVVFT